MDKDIVCIYSGGMDSYTMVALHREHIHTCLSFDYGQRHYKELECASKVCRALKLRHLIVELSALKYLIPGSALIKNNSLPMPEGHYAEESMKQTVVPNRNMIMLSIASAYAMAHKLTGVYFGAHAGDHTIYPDCRPEFVHRLRAAIEIADWQRVTIEAPFINLRKSEILAAGLAQGLDYVNTWTCYKGGEKACGVCGSCQERLEAFAICDAHDPLPYASRQLLLKEGV